jgi:mannose-6-phosphate isomerase-like protein (cupin superfamily)
MIVRGSIASLARQIPRPEHNFRGISGQLPGLPFQVLLFCRSPRTDVRPDFHYRFVWLYAIGGEGNVIIDGVSVRLKAGQRLMIRPYAQHGYESVFGQAPLECVFIAFEMDAARGISSLHGEVQTCSLSHVESLQRLMCDYVALRSHSASHHGDVATLTSQCVLKVASMLEMSLVKGGQESRVARDELTSVNQ